ncbi:DUF3291 domain-containing protein [bacterium (Candidatus Blackallbacteria) CG17_big_fil_post_rev_8_21_14_2_50_48_46]|uniref:DUF3291 domain-containing protein n=1 Tax=bacterium (Candidatus Blackallbacteria) CG17_big_fil_post_rev_8_21_14_2_50_48_46 TaxID=2014261 RepID=A0A2M7G788_9BACT|nr:MAG: DUF3291 domain-containing protein [bacterium (Candidatus Blackallbacteria) CG18_big_fil_WC_8_21_14_2_50_49_26]PIW17941.1 MAG: DUF3291 domain-containing protein [bacterium (Candidatus Blackallbacteria) CG17_big_fil_post_rev_8_21_14_2_50_48_46]PIW45760.1 MAG: DUF3291 domain-containing protein [bacterium (Candidatus Blackallbacteria) CG13_big_fil_rev_8_21_14_2_50_49_14]
MYITVTSLKLKALWFYFELSLHGLKITQQTQKQSGFIKMKNTGFGWMHYTVSAWQSKEALERFSHSGAHLEAIKSGQKLAQEVRIYTYEGDQLPTWKEAKKLLAEKGRVIQYLKRNKPPVGQTKP